MPSTAKLRKSSASLPETETSTSKPLPDLAHFKEGLLEQVRIAGGVKAFLQGQDFIKTLIKSAAEVLLEAEMEAHIGYEKHAKNKKGENHNARNGTTEKTVRGDFGEIQIATPRDRDGSFSPQLIAKRQTEMGHFSEKIISLYGRGMTTREIEQHLYEIYGIDISPQFISHATACLQEEINEWQSRPLEPLYPILYVDGLRVSVKSGNNQGPILKKCVYVVLGVSLTGCQEVLGFWIEENEGAKFWLKVLNDLKSRGLKDIIVACGDGLKGLPEAFAAVYPKADVQLCVVHQIRNACKFVSYKDRKKFCADMRPIYTAPTLESAEFALSQFEQTWQTKYPMSIASWKNNWEKLTTFFSYPVELRKLIYTTNAIESLNAQLRKNIKNRKVFPNDDSLVKLLFLNVKNFTNRWTRKHGWDMVLNQLSILFPERLSGEVLNNL